MVPIVIVASVLIFLTIDLFVLHLARVRAGARVFAEAQDLLGLAEIARFKDRLFGRDHVWTDELATGALRVGVDRFAGILLGKPDRVAVAAEGRRVARGETIATLERGGRTLVVRSPVDGIVETSNGSLPAHPELLADAPLSEGWLCHIRPRVPLVDRDTRRAGEQAAEWMRGELRRLRDLLNTLVPPAQPFAVGETALDGGLPIDGLATSLDASAWDRLTSEIFEGGPSSPDGRPQ